MSANRDWMQSRRPKACMDLDSWLADRDVEVGARGLTVAGLRALDRARGAPGRVREAAFDLLAADALLTYACEWAVESEDPQAALQAILEDTVSDR